MSSQTACFLPISAALLAAESVRAQYGPGLCLGPNVQWNAKNDLQRYLLQRSFGPDRNRIPGLSDLLKAIGDWDLEKVNQFLRDNDFADVQLKDGGADTFYVAAILDALIKWRIEGEPRSIIAQNQRSYPGFSMTEKAVTYWNAPGHPNPVVQIQTQNQDQVFITIAHEPSGTLELLNMVDALSQGHSNNYDWGDAVIPMVDLDQEVPIGWLCGMDTRALSGQRAVITQALQRTLVRMNHLGVVVRSAAAAAVTLECFIQPKPEYVIDAPCLFWIRRPGVETPIVVAWVDYPDWKDPKDLTKKRG